MTLNTTHPAPERRIARPSREWIVSLLAGTVAALGLLNLWSAVIAHGPGRDHLLREVVHVPLMVSHGTRTLTALFGLALLMLARSLARHKRQAWQMTVPLIGVSPFLHIVKGLDYEEAFISLALLALLLAHRSSFYADNDKPSARQGVVGALGMFAFAFVYGPAGYFLLRRTFTPNFTLQRALLESSHVLIGAPGDPVLKPLAHVPFAHRSEWFEASLSVICWFAAGYGLIMLLRPVLPRALGGERDRMRARTLLAAYGAPPLAYFNLLRDKQYLFDSDPEPAWCIGYRLVGRHAVALGDPLGDPRRADDAVRAFLLMCRERDWAPVFYQVTGRCLDIFRASRLHAFKVGEDAVVDVTNFSLRGKAFQDLRTAINKMTKSGILFEELPTTGPTDENALTQLAAITEEWLAAHKGAEKNFAMGAFGPDTELFHDSRFFLARDSATNMVLAFVSFVPIYGGEETPAVANHVSTGDAANGEGTVSASPFRRGYGLDLMRRRSSSPNGIVDFLIVSALLQFQQEGEQVLSLGLSPLAGSCEDDPAGEPEIFDKARELMFERFNRFYNFKGLNAFKAKFAPGWEPRYLVYTNTSALIPCAIAVLRAHNEAAPPWT